LEGDEHLREVYDQPKKKFVESAARGDGDNGSGDGFSYGEESTLPYRYLRDWVISRFTSNGEDKREASQQQQSQLVELLSTETLQFLNNTSQNENEVIEIMGRLMLGTSAATLATEDELPIRIRLKEGTQCLMFDRSPTYRGYWIRTSHAFYWLHEPSASSPSPTARAALASSSEILVRVFGIGCGVAKRDDKRIRQIAATSADTLMKQFDYKLARAVGPAVVEQIGSGLHPVLNPSCAFLQSLLAVSDSYVRKTSKKQKKATMSEKELLERTIAVERRLTRQAPWGQPRTVEETAAATTTTEGKLVDCVGTEDGGDKAMSIDMEEQGEASEFPPKKKKKRSTRGSGSQRTAKRIKLLNKDDVLPRVVETATEATSTSSSHEEHEEEGGKAQGEAIRNNRYPRRASVRPNYAEESDGDDDEDSTDQVAEKGRLPKAVKKTVKRKKADSDEEADFPESPSESEDQSDVAGDEDNARVPELRAAASKNDGEKQKMYLSFDPINAPANKSMSLEEIEKQKEFLDPCGVEATDDIVGRLVGGQFDKISGLLLRSLEDGGLGSAKLPLQLGTACSGTDAPALALSILKEQMELRDLGHLFKHTHEFSCENEPFKQGELVVICSVYSPLLHQIAHSQNYLLALFEYPQLTFSAISIQPCSLILPSCATSHQRMFTACQRWCPPSTCSWRGHPAKTSQCKNPRNALTLRIKGALGRRS